MSTTSSNTNSVSGPIVRYDPNQARPLQVENEIVGSSSKTEPESQAGSSEAVLPTPVFVTISTNARLGEGISIVRSLGGGQYEIMNIGQTDHATLTSEETAHMIKADDERMKAMNSARMQWGKLSYTVNQTIKAAEFKIFRFGNLPIELRYCIYEFTLLTPHLLKSMSTREHHESSRQKLPGLSLTETCRWIYAETRPFFYKNSLEINEVCRNFKPLLPTLKENLRNVTFSWWGFSSKDRNTLKFFASCKNLRVLNILITRFTVENSFHTHQSLFQDEPSIAKFSGCNGFDNLFEIQGLERVTVRPETGLSKPFENQCSEAEFKAFEKFLNRHLVAPEVEPEVSPPKKKTKTQIRRREKQRTLLQKSLKARPLPTPRIPRTAKSAAALKFAQQLSRHQSDDDDDDDESQNDNDDDENDEDFH